MKLNENNGSNNTFKNVADKAMWSESLTHGQYQPRIALLAF